MDAVDDKGKIRRAYRYRIYPTGRHQLALEAQLTFACQLYNAALEQRRDVWRRQRQSLGYVAQCRDLTALRAAEIGPSGMNCSVMRDPLRRLDLAFAAFYRRVKAGGKPGYPRFRSAGRYDSLTWASGWAVRDRRLALQGIGHLKVKWHRALPESAVVRTVTVRRVAGRWYACFSLLVSRPALPGAAQRPAVGIDLIRQLSGGLAPVAGRPTAGIEAGEGSRRRQKLGFLLERKHERIRNIRHDHAHKLTRRLVSDFGLIAVEDLNIRGLAQGFLAKHVTDQGWNALLTVLEYKAAEAGTQLVRVMPGGSSRGALAAAWWFRNRCRSERTAARIADWLSTATSTRRGIFFGSA